MRSLTVAGRVLAVVLGALALCGAAAASGFFGETIKVKHTSYLSDTACWRNGCVAVGSEQNSGRGLTVYRGKVSDVPGTVTLNHVDCHGGTLCTAVGQGSGGGGAIVQIDKGKPGKAVQVGYNLAAISCTSSSSCWAPGNQANGGGMPHTSLVVHIVDGKIVDTVKVKGRYPYLFTAGEAGGSIACFGAECLIAGKLSDSGPGAIFRLKRGKITLAATVGGSTAVAGISCFSLELCRISGYQEQGNGRQGFVATLEDGKAGHVHDISDSFLGPIACLGNERCFVFGNHGIYPKISNIVLAVDKHGKPVGSRKIRPNIQGVFCSHTCVAAGSVGMYPNAEGVLLDKFVF